MAFDLKPSALPDDAVEVGRFLDAWGVKGWLKILPHWINRLTFTAQALDLPIRPNEMVSLMVGSLTWSDRPCIKFLFVASQL